MSDDVTLKNVEHVCRDQWATMEEVDEQLAEFVDSHPTFAERFNIAMDSRGVEARGLEPATAGHGNPRIESEWDFATTYGYNRAVVDILTTLNEAGVSMSEDDDA